MCVEDFNVLLELMGREERIEKFIDSQYSTIFAEKRADKVAIPKEDENVIYNLECESAKSLYKAVLKQDEYGKVIHQNNRDKIVKNLMLVTEDIKQGLYTIQWGYHGQKIVSEILSFRMIDGEENLKYIKQKLINNKKLNRHDIIFLVWAAYTKYNRTTFDFLYEVEKVLNQAIKKKLITNQDDIQGNIKILHIQDCNRLVPKEKQNELYKVIEMKSFAVEEYGNMRMNEGIKKNKRDIAAILKDKGYPKSDILESCKISEEEYLNL